MEQTHLAHCLIAMTILSSRHMFDLENPTLIATRLGKTCGRVSVGSKTRTKRAFDYKYCEAIRNESKCSAKVADTPIKTQLRSDWVEKKYLRRESYGTADENPAWSGFAGEKWVWQMARPNSKQEAGEVWADMFLGWVYENLGTDRMDYMNEVMPNYLRIIGG